MVEKTESSNLFKMNVSKAVKALREKDYAISREYLQNAMLENCEDAEVYNLLGILAELTGDLRVAGKYYRVSGVFDPTYNPASRNLERITSFNYCSRNINPDFGDMLEEAESIEYVIEYDGKNIGHLKRKESAE